VVVCVGLIVVCWCCFVCVMVMLFVWGVVASVRCGVGGELGGLL
jgi:hypothetical protein